MPLNVSARARGLSASPIRKLAPLAAAARKRGVVVHGLNIGQPDLPTPFELRAKLADVPKIIAYSPSEGTEEFLAVMQRYYDRVGVPVAPEDILATTGGSEALLFALLAVGDPGDEVLVPEPFYTNYATFAAMAGMRVRPIATRAEDGFHLPDRPVWEAAIGPRTRAILLCNPSNPTGTVATRRELEIVADLAKRHHLFLISDEVYREFAFDGRVATSALTLDLPDRVIVVDSLSKRYGACGMRLGCLVTKSVDVREATLKMAQARLSPPGLAQLAALGVQDLPHDYADKVRATYEARRDALFPALAAIPGVVLEKPEGAFYCVARLPVDDAESFARFLLADFSLGGETVAIAPAEGFYATPGLGKDEARIAYVVEEAALRRAAKILVEGVAAYASLRSAR